LEADSLLINRIWSLFIGLIEHRDSLRLRASCHLPDSNQDTQDIVAHIAALKHHFSCVCFASVTLQESPTGKGESNGLIVTFFSVFVLLCDTFG
jgi:hypothetical protein